MHCAAFSLMPVSRMQNDAFSYSAAASLSCLASFATVAACS